MIFYMASMIFMRGNSPFQATNLHMGIDPIEVTKVVYEEPDLLIFGENFNEYSKVFLGTNS